MTASEENDDDEENQRVFSSRFELPRARDAGTDRIPALSRALYIPCQGIPGLVAP